MSRGYHLHVVYKLSDAIQYIAEDKPEYAILSADLIPTKSAWLFGILSQVTNPILFAERVSARTLSISQEYKDIFFLEPPLTPMALEQMMKRVTRDQLKQSESASKLNNTQVQIMSALSDLALNAVCKSSNALAPNAPPKETVQLVKRITCFRVNSLKMAGYLIIAYGQDRRLDAQWTADLQHQLKKHLSSFDQAPLIDPSEELVIEEIDFDQWSKEQAEFVRKASHHNAEVVMAFFKDTSSDEMKPSVQPDHVQMDIHQLGGDTTVNFDVFIYLPQNARFVLYTPKGGTFYENQKQKLISDGIQSVHINKKHLNEIRRHRTDAFVKSSAAAFHN
jgi:hypothetical protein